jgi:sulfite reductase beta subunit-like hemoprotein
MGKIKMINAYELLTTVKVSADDLVVPEEIDRLAQLIKARQRGSISEQFFLKARLQQGIYSMRGPTDRYMVRVRVPLGRLNEVQLEQLGLIAERYSDGRGHVTTRQDVQLYDVALADIPAVLRALAEANLTTRETAGNVVRNVTVDPLAGVSPDELFDVRPYAEQVMRFFLRNPLAQNLPRKVKIAFSGSPADRAMVRVHDIGGFAAVRLIDGRLMEGFELYVGGGLGATPALAQSLEVFTPADRLLPTLEAVMRVFDRLGDRENKARARLKFLVGTMGIEAFRQTVLKERELVEATESVIIFPQVKQDRFTPPSLSPRAIPPGEAPFTRWVSTNVVPQKQPGYIAAYVTLPTGDLSVLQFRALAEMVREFGQGELVTTASQNLLLRWVSAERLPDLYQALAAIELNRPGVHRLSNPISCAGATTCPLALTTSHTLAQELARRWAEHTGWWLSDELADAQIKISGCPNACGQHHLAPIGLYGISRKVNGRDVPHYNLLLGGRVGEADTRFGQSVARIPARRVPEALEAVLNAYRQRRQPDESFLAWVDRLEQAKQLKELVQSILQPFLSVDSPSDYSDWGQQAKFTIQIGANECAA